MVLTSLAGLLALLGKAALEQAVDVSIGNSSSIVPSIIDGLNIVSVVLVAVVGLGSGLFSKVPVLLVGPATVAGLPILSVIDALAFGGHNLLPFEILFQGLLVLPATCGAALGRMIRLALGHLECSSR